MKYLLRSAILVTWICSQVATTPMYAQSQTQTLNGDSWEKVKSNKKGTLTCLWNESYGIVYKNNNNELKGVCIDILGDFVVYVKEKYNTDITLKFVEEASFRNFLQRVSVTPNVLGVSSASITEERKRILRFTNPFLTNPNIIVTSKEAPKLARLEDLAVVYKGFRAKVVEGSNHHDYVKDIKKKYYPDLGIETAASTRLILEDIVKNKNMFTIIDFAEYVGATRNKLSVVRQNVQLDLVDKMGFIMSLKSDWGPIWNEFLSKEYINGIGYRKIVSGNMGSSYLSLLGDK
jgi:ABC-type amino acid transport substrate-binding protein